MSCRQITLGICCLLLAVSVAEALAGMQWGAYKRRFNKTYADRNEEQIRKAILAQSEQQVREHNAKHAKERGFTMAINQLSDWTPEERARLRGFRAPERAPENSAKAQRFLDRILNDDAPVPYEVDWRSVPGRVTRVKDQGDCGSCWAFATTGVLEGQMVARSNGNKSRKLIELSEQQLVDCSLTNNGCDGGLMSYALNDIRGMGGIEDETSYPYVAATTKCSFNQSQAVMGDMGSALLPRGQEEILKIVVAKFGPVSAAMFAMEDFDHYLSGVYFNQFCNDLTLNHAVLIVGYGANPDDGDYWIAKNSWNDSWGDKGYFKIARNRNNQCGIASFPTIPTF